jgi:hypothetical protein
MVPEEVVGHIGATLGLLIGWGGMGIKGGWRGIMLLELAKELAGMVVGGSQGIG